MLHCILLSMTLYSLNIMKNHNLKKRLKNLHFFVQCYPRTILDSLKNFQQRLFHGIIVIRVRVRNLFTFYRTSTLCISWKNPNIGNLLWESFQTFKRSLTLTPLNYKHGLLWKWFFYCIKPYLATFRLYNNVKVLLLDV